MAEVKAPDVKETTPSPDQKDSSQEGQKEQEFIAGKFKTQEDFVKSYDELQSKLGSMGEKVGTLEAYSANANTLINALYSDPDIQKVIEQKYGGQTGQQPQQPQQTTPQQQQAPTQQPPVVDPKLAEMERAMRLEAIKGFDSRFNVKPEEIKEVHDKVGQELYSMGYDVKTIPVDLMPGMMEKAYKLAYPEKVLEAAKQEGAAQTMTNMQAQIPSQGGGQIREEQKTLTPQQQEWIKKLGKSEGDVQKVLSNPEKAQ
jgi:hypothetical protein